MSLNPESRILNPRAAHLIGVCGSGMRSLAELLVDRGWRVSGSDAAAEGHNAAMLCARGVELHAGHAAGFVADADEVVFSPAVPATNPERVAARERGIPEHSYPQALGRLMSGRTGVAIAGTHGKSTTTAMLGWILESAGQSPSVICGGELLNRNAGGWSGSGAAVVVEACEYQGSFFNLAPRHAALLDIEPDHFDCYADLDSAIAAYRAFVAQLPAEGLLVCRADRPAVGTAVAGAAARVETFGVETSADWTAHRVRLRPGQTSFRIERHGQAWADCVLHVPGEHNVLNAVAAVALAAELGVGPDAVRQALADFRGVRRRCERLGSWRGVELVDDYAHHPTAVAATLAAVRAEFPGRPIRCVFQPHQVSRTRTLMAELADSFREADHILLLPVYSAREAAGDHVTASQELLHKLKGAGRRAMFVPSLDRLVAVLETDARPGEVVLLIGAGDIDRVRDELSRRIPRHYAS
ncbi:MAG: UDP-N-acetylmuramate--L-alanine ligase [Planctomycetaceae bacterium]|nr:UDP-N-acetylmuramate--L-alanine ligase [Planctomycetaceae bacterium]